MSWNRLTNFLLKLALVLLICWVLTKLIEYAVKSITIRKAWYKEWLKKQREIRTLLFEKNRLSDLLVKIKRYVRITLIFLKLILVLTFFGFTYVLVVKYDMLYFNALGVAAGAVTIIYKIVAFLLNRRIKNLNDLLDTVEVVLENIYMRRFKIKPNSMIAIDMKLEKVRKEADLLKHRLRS